MSIMAETQVDLARVDDGTPGTNGISVTSVTPQYYLSTSDSSATGGSWVDTPPAFVSGNYYWTREKTTYSDGNTDYSTGVYNAGMTQASQDAKDANTKATNTAKYFWFNSVDSGAGEGAGAHITEVDRDTFVSDPSNGGGNTLIDSNGVSIRDGVSDLATFGSSGVVVGQNLTGYSRTEIGTGGMQIYQNAGTNTQLANIGYGSGNSSSGTASAPYYSFGTRSKTNTAYSSSSTYEVGDLAKYNDDVYVCISAITTPEAWTSSHWKLYIGNYSFSEGLAQIASGYGSHAEGQENKAMGLQSHAEGFWTSATGDHSHAEGESTTASGDDSHSEGLHSIASGSYAHAEGYYTTASGLDAHAQNSHTIAGYNDQTAIGSYNNNKSTNAFEIGNGTADNNRKNALEVDWNGNVDMAGHINSLYKITTTAITCPATAAHGYQSTATYTIPSGDRVSGYELAGIVGVQSASSRIVPFGYYKDSNTTIRAGFVNVTASATTSDTSVTFHLLWVKGTSA